MPLAKIHVVEGRYDEDRIAKVSSAVQAALMNTLRVPPEDFYQLICARGHGALEWARKGRRHDRERRWPFPAQGRAAGFESAPHDTHDVHLRQDRHREAQWHAGYRALRPQGLICWPSDEHTVGSAASCLFQRRGSMDLPHHALSSRDGPRANRGDRIVARERRDVAGVARILSGFDRDALPRSGFFFCEDLLLRRHDYSVTAGGFRAAQLTSDYAEANGIRLPTKRRAYTRGPDRRPILEMLMVSIDISDVSFA
jgi:hypothetical protein